MPEASHRSHQYRSESERWTQMTRQTIPTSPIDRGREEHVTAFRRTCRTVSEL